MRKVTDEKSNEKQELSVARKAAVERMQAGVQAMVASGKSPRARGIQKTTAALYWIYSWGWSSSYILGHLTGTARGTALAIRLEANGWIKRTPIRIVSHYQVAPSDVLTITHAGVAELTVLLGELPRTVRSSWTDRVPKKDMIHDLRVQQLTLEYMGRCPGACLDPAIIQEHGRVKTFMTPLHPELGTSEVKRPDAIWVMEDGCWLAIELELSPKWDRELDQFTSRHIDLQRREVKPIYALVTFFASSATEKRYREAMRPGAPVKPWHWDANYRKWSPMMLTPRDLVPDDVLLYTGVLQQNKPST